ncbi:MAG: ureidoglycolate hydrolase [Proteobacteria bacterium]|nr:MAG: ureidoglycolate hydrolase [Pseudomonadota bacterium]
MPPDRAPMTIVAEAATMAAFAPYGALLPIGSPGDAGRAVNQGRARRHPGLRDLSHDAAASRPVLDLYRIEPSTLPFALVCFERHPLTAQAFVPLEDVRLLVAVAPDDNGRPDIGRARAFIVERAIVHYRAGAWHAPLVALDAPARLAMLMWETGDARDCEEVFLTEPVTVI